MKRIYLFCVITLMYSLTANSQSLIAVQNGGTPRFYELLSEAINNSNEKDTIYIPGGAFSLDGTLVINKELHLIGVGHHPDSTATTGKTLLNGNILIQNGASNGSLSGFLLNGTILIGRTDVTDEVINFTIERCNIGAMTFQKNGSQNNACIYFTVKESIINGNLEGGYSRNNAFFNNFLINVIYFDLNNVFKNNLIREIAGPVNGCNFENNIFYTLNYHYGVDFRGNSYLAGTMDDFYASNCSFNRNMHVAYLSQITNTSGIYNYQNQEFGTIFVNPANFQSQIQNGSVYPSFNYTDDYHVQSTSSGKNGGTDGTDVGLYGGTFPWKDGSIPSNPHFQSVQISGKTDNSGKLNVKIKVAAQDN